MAELIKEVIGDLDKIPEKVCCVCGHSLETHIDEGDVWRCHSLGQDFYQCECALRKNKPFQESEGEKPILYYDLKRRLKEQIEEN